MSKVGWIDWVYFTGRRWIGTSLDRLWDRFCAVEDRRYRRWIYTLDRLWDRRSLDRLWDRR